jgi:hypothetical protein
MVIWDWYFVHYNWLLVINEFVITEFVITKFQCIKWMTDHVKIEKVNAKNICLRSLNFRVNNTLTNELSIELSEWQSGWKKPWEKELYFTTWVEEFSSSSCRCCGYDCVGNIAQNLHIVFFPKYWVVSNWNRFFGTSVL